MDTSAWPFLVGRNRTLGYRTIVAPPFIHEANALGLLADAPIGHGDGPDALRYREVRGGPPGDFSVVYRMVGVNAGEIGLGADGPLLDDFGRPILLLEGIVLRGRRPEIAVTRTDLDRAHSELLADYAVFWETADGSFRAQRSWPFNLPSSDNGQKRIVPLSDPPLQAAASGASRPEMKALSPALAPAAGQSARPGLPPPPVPWTDAKPRKRRVRGVALATASSAIGVVAAGAVLIAALTRPRDSPQKAVQAFCASLHADNYSDAYNRLSRDLRDRYPYRTFVHLASAGGIESCTLEQPALTAVSGQTWSVTVMHEDGLSTSTEISLVQEDGKWRLGEGVLGSLQ